jgi:ankyrin repeat protein
MNGNPQEGFKMSLRRVFGSLMVILLMVGSASAAGELADAAMKANKEAVRALLQQRANVNEPQADGATALHWTVRWDDAETTDLLIRAGANVNAASRVGTTPLVLAINNGSAAMIDKLIKAGANTNLTVTKYGDTLLMLAAKSGNPNAVKLLLDNGAQVDAVESYGGTTALMWAVSEGHTAAAKLLIDRGANVNARSKIIPTSPGQWQAKPVETGDPKVGYLGGLTPIMFATRQNDLATTQMLVAAGADVNAVSADGKSPLNLAIYNGNYDLASYLIDAKADVNKPDAENFTPLFWAVEKRLMENSPTTPWLQTQDPMFLIEKLIKSGANVNAPINAIPPSRTRGRARLRFGNALTRAAFGGDLALVKVLLAAGADPLQKGTDDTTALMAASGYGFVDTYSTQKSTEERLELVKLLVELGSDVNAASDIGVTPIMAAAHLAQIPIIEYLVSKGANLAAHDVGKGNGASAEPLMPIDFAIGVTTFQPNAIVNRPEAEALIRKMMEERGIKHTTSECTLRGFTCGDIDPKVATPEQIQILRARQTGNQVQGITGGAGIKQ